MALQPASSSVWENGEHPSSTGTLGLGVEVAMNRRKGRQNEFQLAVKKFLDHGRDPGRRLRSLKQAEGKGHSSGRGNET